MCALENQSHTCIALYKSENRSLGYVKDNDVHYGLKVAHRDPKLSKMIGLQCCSCIAFGWEGKVGSKCKAATTVQGWSHPFHYDNIENHLRNHTLWSMGSILCSRILF